jgi:Ca-activated chloride channel homolog
MKISSWMVLGALATSSLVGCGDSLSASADEGNSRHFEPSPGTAGSASRGTPPNTGAATGGSLSIDVGEEDEAEPGEASAGASSGEDPGEPKQVFSANPFVITAHDPLSTFAADVDTASYDIFTSSIENGSLPPRSTVRLEEFVNYFHYGYEAPAQDAEHPFNISLAAAPALDPSTLLLRVGIQGRLPSLEKRAANLVFLVDTSGSMSAANKLPLVQYTLIEALAVLDPADTISIVTYAGSTELKLPPTPVEQAPAIEQVIAALSASGSTNGGSGIQLAYQQARKGYLQDGINHVVLCTDGDFNVGITSNDELVDLIVKQRESGVTFTALGFGASPNDAMMERVSNAGNGTYSVIYSEDAAREYVSNRLLGSLDYIAKDMKIQVEFNPERVYAYRLLGYEDRDIADGDFRNDVVDAGEVGAGHRVTALYQLVLTGGAIPQSTAAPAPQDGAPYSGAVEVTTADFALVKVRYKSPDATTSDPAREVSRALVSVADDFSELDPDFQWAYAVASFAEILKGSPYAVKGKLETIQEIIGQSIYDGLKEREQFRTSFAAATKLIQ